MATASIPTITLYWEVGTVTYSWGATMSTAGSSGSTFEGIDRLAKEIEKRRDVKNIRYVITLSNIDS